MGSSNTETVLVGYEAYNRGDVEGWTGPYSEDAALADHPQSLRLSGHDQLKAWKAQFRRSFPDDRVTDPLVIDAGDSVVVPRFVARGKNDGPLGSFPATGRTYSVPVCEVFRFDREGRIVAQDVYYDQLSLLIQLGHAQLPQS